MECQEGKKCGFVNFKTRTFDESHDDRDAKRNSPIEIPEHLRNDMPDPLAGAYKTASTTKIAGAELKTGDSYASEADRLRSELEILGRKKAAVLAQMGVSVNTSLNSSNALPAPAIAFKKRR